MDARTALRLLIAALCLAGALFASEPRVPTGYVLPAVPSSASLYVYRAPDGQFFMAIGEVYVRFTPGKPPEYHGCTPESFMKLIAATVNLR